MNINNVTMLHMGLSNNDLTNFSTSNPSALHLILHKFGYIINIFDPLGVWGSSISYNKIFCDQVEKIHFHERGMYTYMCNCELKISHHVAISEAIISWLLPFPSEIHLPQFPWTVLVSIICSAKQGNVVNSLQCFQIWKLWSPKRGTVKWQLQTEFLEWLPPPFFGQAD